MPDTQKMIRVHLIISGTVQGVFFRKHACEKARELRITGWVANEADGTVAVVAEGPENQVNLFTDWCHSGPSRAFVEKVQIEQVPYMNEFTDFDIRY
jgi:acylphosphatase